MIREREMRCKVYSFLVWRKDNLKFCGKSKEALFRLSKVHLQLTNLADKSNIYLGKLLLSTLSTKRFSHSAKCWTIILLVAFDRNISLYNIYQLFAWSVIYRSLSLCLFSFFLVGWSITRTRAPYNYNFHEKNLLAIVLMKLCAATYAWSYVWTKSLLTILILQDGVTLSPVRI